MRKDIQIVILSLILLLFSGRAALASQADWQINWQEDGTLLERVMISDYPIQNEVPGWQKNINGNTITFTRTVGSWDRYNQLQDKLPLKMEQKNYVFFNASKLTASNQIEKGSLYSSLNGIDKMKLSLNVPGVIVSSSIKPSEKQTIVWEVNHPGRSFDKGFSLSTINLDGFMLGITILTLGVIGLFFFFVGRMRRVNRLIDETYSLDNVIIEDDDIELEEERKD